MLKLLRKGASGFESPALANGWTLPDEAVWIELVDPTREEEQAAEAALGLELPTREEMAAIEPSSRLYQDRGATFMTASILTHSQDEFPVLAPVTFVLAGERLVTIRYAEPRAFAVYAAQAERHPHLCQAGPDIFLGLLDAVVERIADILEGVAGGVEEVSYAVFHRPRGGFEPLLARLGRFQMVNAKARDCLVSIARLTSFAALAEQIEGSDERREHLRSLQRDAQSLTDHTGHVAANITFLLDAAVGLIGIEQNAIIKIFSVAAVAFLPPTLIASIYGMNFRHLPELDWPYGYPLALAAMVASAVIPLWWFRRKGWL